MNGCFNSSEFEAFKVEFGLKCFTSVRHGPSGSCWLRKFWRFFNGKNAEKSFKCWSFFDFRKRWGAYTCQSGSYQKDHYEIPVHHQVAFGFGNFEDNYLMEEKLKEALNRDLCLTLGRDEGPTSVSREAARKGNYMCLWNSPSTPLFLFLKGLIMSGNPEISL